MSVNLGKFECSEDARAIAVQILTELRMKRLYLDPSYDGEASAIFASELCGWYFGASLDPTDRSGYRIELRLSSEKVDFALLDHKGYSQLSCFRFSAGHWTLLHPSDEAAEVFKGKIRNWYEMFRPREDVNPVAIVNAETDPLSPIVLGMITSIIEKAR